MRMKNGFEPMDCLFLVCQYSSKMKLQVKSKDYFQIIKLHILKQRKVVIGLIIVNIVEPCKAIFFLHSEPGGAFFPLEIEEYEQLTFITVPSKFDVEIDADYSWLSNADVIPKYARSVSYEEFLEQQK